MQQICGFLQKKENSFKFYLLKTKIYFPIPMTRRSRSVDMGGQDRTGQGCPLDVNEISMYPHKDGHDWDVCDSSGCEEQKASF